MKRGWAGRAVNIAGHDGCLVAEVGKLLRLYLGVCLCVCVCECVYIRQQPFQCFFSFCLPSLLPNQPPPPPDNLPRVSARGESKEEE